MSFTPYSTSNTGVTGSSLGISGAMQGAPAPSQTLAQNSASAELATSSEASTQVGAGADTLVLKITQDAYQGDAQYAVYVDGKQVGGTFTAEALHNSGRTDTLEVKGDWGVGSHTVAVQLLNDLYHGTPATDRNVYIEGATYNGAAVAGSSLYVNSTSAKTFTFTEVAPPSATVTQVGTGPDTLVLKITQDAYQGDAQYAVYVDGKQVGGTFTAKALHNSGQSDTLEIKGDWGVGNHNVSVRLLNDLYHGTPATDRNVYVEGATYNGAAVPGSNLYVNSPSAKGFTVTDTGTTPPPTTGAKLTKTTTPITTTHDGQVIENLDIWVDNGDALMIRHDNVVVQNVRIHHRTGDGISVDLADNVKIHNVEVINSDPPTGQDPETSPEIRNIAVDKAHGLQIDHVTVRDGSTGIFVLDSPGTHISHVDGYNFRGPMPRGQFVQFDKSGDSTLTDFYTFHDKDHSHPEEAINVFMSPNVHIANGVIDGNNAPSGNGIMFEFGSTGGRVNNVDAMHMGNGAFSAYASDIVFDDTRTFDSIWGDQGLGPSVSNGLQWNIAAADVHILHSTYTRPGNPGNIVWDRRIAAEVDVREDPGAIPMAPHINHYDWVV